MASAKPPLILQRSPVCYNRVMEIEAITIEGGLDRNGKDEPVGEVSFEMGSVVSVVGPTGSGKTALINDISLFADRNTPTRRRVLVNGQSPPDEYIEDPSVNPVAMITQHTNFLSDLSVRNFLTVHAEARCARKGLTDETLEFANRLTGEPIIDKRAMTELSGGQARALMISDAVVIGNSPVILLDEIENAGIDRVKAVELLKAYRKIFIFVTHDLRIALHSDFRVVMREGAMQKVLATDYEEKRLAGEVVRLDDLMQDMRNRLRNGQRLTEDILAGFAKTPEEV